MYDIALMNGNVYQDQTLQKINVYIKNGMIACLSDAIHDAKETLDIEGKEVFPGIIDPHVHFDLDLGHIRSKDDFYHGSKAALFGGVTTVVDFLEPTTNKDDLLMALKRRLEEAKATLIDVKFHACIANPKGDLEAYVQAMKRLGLNTLKLFTTYSESNRRTNYKAIKRLLQLSRPYDFLLLGHLETDNLITLDPAFTVKDLPRSRPTKAETQEAAKIAEMVEETHGKLYMVHCSSGQTIKYLKNHHQNILNKDMFIESCPQYFTFTDAMLDSKEGALYTCAPPLRSASEQSLLKEHIDDIDTIGTDHCAFNKADKEKPHLKDVPLGIGSIEHVFQLMYTMFGLKVVDKMTITPAKRFKLEKKGKINVGYEADLFVYEKNPTTIKTHHGATDYNPYEGQPVNGEIIHTIKSGQFSLKDKQLCKRIPQGRWLSF